MSEIFLPGDKVYYTGKRFPKLISKAGWIDAQVENNPNSFVVSFPDTRDGKDPTDSDDYVMPVGVLTHWRPAPGEKKHEGPEVQPRRRRRSEDDE